MTLSSVVYQVMDNTLIFVLFNKQYDVRMEKDAGYGRSDIIAHPLHSLNSLAYIFEIKTVSSHSRRNGKQSLKTAERIQNELEQAKTGALKQIDDRGYRQGVPLHERTVHEYAVVFCGKSCAAAVRTFERKTMKDKWELMAISDCMVTATDSSEEYDMDEDACQ